jgi:hypothetical protein
VLAVEEEEAENLIGDRGEGRGRASGSQGGGASRLHSMLAHRTQRRPRHPRRQPSLR